MKPRSAAIIGGAVSFFAIIGFIVIGGSGILNNLSGVNPAGINNLNPQPQFQGVEFAGNINFQATCTNVGNGSAMTCGTNNYIKYFKKAGDTYNLVSDTDGTYSIPPGDDDIIYAQVSPVSGQAFFHDWEETLKANGGGNGAVKKPSYLDITKDGVYDYLYPIDISEKKKNADPNQNPVQEFIVQSRGDQTLTLDSPSSQLSIGTGSKSATINWKVTFDTQPGTEAIRVVQGTVNGTLSTNEVAEEQSYIDFPDSKQANGYQRIGFADTTTQVSQDFTSGSTKSIFRHVFSSHVDGAAFITVGAQGTKSVFIPVTIGTIMDASTDAVCVELRLEPVNALDVPGTALVDDVELVAGASNVNECSV